MPGKPLMQLVVSIVAATGSGLVTIKGKGGHNSAEGQLGVNGKSCTLKGLANSSFPDLGDEYNKLQGYAYTHFKNSFWNLVIIKCCSFHENYHDSFNTPNHPAAQFYLLVQNTFSPQNKEVYVRGEISSYNDDGTIDWSLIYYNLGIGGYPFPDKAAAVLFMDVPVHIVYPGGHRSYVFQQFSTTKPVFKVHEMASYPNDSGNNFGGSDDWHFAGGLFPRLIQ
ncbi:MAG: hypothetical protein ABIQ31_25715 [Ferruginibacter sp.]